nr:hypothetical protein BaRGS_029943 [Batillaria attramentaria]
MSKFGNVLAEIVEAAVEKNDEKLVIEALQQSGKHQAQFFLVSNPTLFIRLCAKGFSGAVEQALSDCGDVMNYTAELEGRTALQWACLLGYLDIVQLLRPHVEPMQDAWRETSELYSSSLGGHLEIVKELTYQYPDLVKSADVRSALLYAACCGGSIEVAKFWVTPNIDINKPVELVSNLQNCENMVPLCAACEGKHEALAKYLMENFGAEVTQHIAEQFPELTAKLVESVYRPLRMDNLDSEDSEVRYKLHKAQVHMVHPVWLQPWLTSITHLDLSNNKLRQLPDCVPWSLPNLIYINVSHNLLAKLQPPREADGVLCQRLEEVFLSHNELSEVCSELLHLTAMTRLELSHNCLVRLKSHPSTETSPGPKKVMWQCSNLATLNLSHNQLDLLTNEICGCSVLKKLNISNNRLCSLPSPWACNLESLDASHNTLERFPSSTEQFWSGSLTSLSLHHNSLDQLGENILKLGTLEKLDVSHNCIEFIVSPLAWDCPSLLDLNLSHNKLGSKIQPEFPSEMLVNLRQLNLSDNQLSTLPLSVCALRNLVSLDISNNPLRDLPQEMGNLTECWDLRLQGLDMRKADLQEAIKKGRSQDVIEHLRKQLRKVQPCHTVKLIVLGPQGKGKSTVVQALAEGSMKPVTVSDKCITRTTVTLKSHSKLYLYMTQRKDVDRPDLTLRLWELPGQPELLALHPVMWTENSLFVLVWDVTAGITHLDHWLCSLQARLARVAVIIVATFRDRLPTTSTEASSRVDQFHMEINQLYGHAQEKSGVYPKEDHRKIYPHLSSVLVVSLTTRQTFKQDLALLKNAIYSSALQRRGNRAGEFLIGQQLPLSYMKLDKALVQLAEDFQRQERPPYLSQTDFEEMIRFLPESDFDSFGDLTDAVKMCCQMGSLLHFDVWTEGLARLYFLDPDWLARMIATVLMPGGREVSSRQAIQTVQMDLFQQGLPGNILQPFLQLLKHFDIGTPISEHGEERLLLPCHLPRQAPGLQLPKQQHGSRLFRFYTLPHIPDSLWSRLILGLLLSLERQGSRMEKPRMVYWQKGLNITYNGGSVVIESAVFRSSQEEMEYSGILISILPDSASVTNLAIVGFVSEEVDSAVQNFFPHHSDRTELFGTYALCPICFDHVRPGEGVIRGDFRHFAVPECAGSLLKWDYIRCHKGNYIALDELVPEFLLTEMPKKLHLDTSQLHVSSKKLGGGAAGSVYKGMLGKTEVAVKVFYSDLKPGDISPSTDSGTSSFSSNGSQLSAGCSYPPLSLTANSGLDAPLTTSSDETESQGVYGNFAFPPEHMQVIRQDSIDGRNIKICQAFTELRQETIILAQLRHPCLISLLGVSVRPRLLVVLELAPLGSLRSVLKSSVVDRPFNKYMDRDKTFPSLLQKDITFKMFYQMAVGLEYLHERKILYRDLKSDNILVCSLDPKETVNIKISDYGISKFATSQIMGMVGTPGYMAPEIMEGQAYDEKIDIFSFSMVMYEVLTGHAPFEKCDRLHQIHSIINIEKRRPSLKEYNVIACFPYLEDLMREMWAHDPSERPSAKDIVQRMKDVAFLMQHSHIAAADDRVRERSASIPDACDANLFCNITCVWASRETSSLAGRNTCWVWEYPTGLLYDRRLSIYNLASNQYHIYRKVCAGQQVTCMAKVGSNVWVGIMGGSVEIFGSSCTDIPKRKALLADFGSPLIVEYDLHADMVSGAYCIEAELEVDISEVKLSREVETRQYEAFPQSMMVWLWTVFWLSKTHCGLAQAVAQSLVVAVRNVSQASQSEELAEISVWEACTADRITDIRHYWQSLETLKAQLDQQDKLKP